MKKIMLLMVKVMDGGSDGGGRGDFMMISFILSPFFDRDRGGYEDINTVMMVGVLRGGGDDNDDNDEHDNVVVYDDMMMAMMMVIMMTMIMLLLLLMMI